jgi:formylglycine-generating enzyme
MRHARLNGQLATAGAWASLGLVALAVGCCKSKESPTGVSSSVATPASGAPSAGGVGPLAAVGAGNLVAGSPCQSIPRITTEELEGVEIQMGAFDIDVYPYPNDPAQPPMTNVTRDEAQAMCASRGRRLCTELEWERACKGPANQTYEYGKSYSPNYCATGGTMLKPVGSYDKCQSGFGVKATHGVVWEWTSSEWGRGGPGGMAVVRGGWGPHKDLQMRCANGQSRSPADKSAESGFRCCGGPQNPATVNLVPRVLPVLVPEGSVDSALQTRMLQALAPSLKEVPAVTFTFDKVWRWHPRANEELVLARYVGKRSTAGAAPFYHPMVLHFCGGSTVLLAHLRGPVEKMQEPGGGVTAEEIAIGVETGKDRGEVRFSYHYGAVNVTQPAWIKAGSTLDAPDAGSAPSASGPTVRLRPPMIPVRK